ncbi:hypothetical protein FOZ61_001302 [Perkinsus olseni]|uniref:Uncharacterized protein n=1 Tax=Perkinsus olseni TaxID=32597 RepID=A0A7J6LP15_PEROL|nr:hypothetical protein FOL46_005888 [Perkinsus olseni]KAF4663890.1 hypothetical protein FOZ61_001302 [Perkinsus olseni]
MDNQAALQFAEVIAKEIGVQTKWLKDMDLSDAKPMPTSETYKSSSIAKIPSPAAVATATGGNLEDSVGKSVKPVPTRENFRKAIFSFGFVFAPQEEQKRQFDPRPANNTVYGTNSEQRYPLPPKALRNTEYYGITRKCIDDFYSTSGAFEAVIEKLRRGGRNLVFTAISFTLMALLVIVPCVLGMVHVRRLLSNLREREARDKEGKREAALKKHAQRESEQDKGDAEAQTPMNFKKAVLDLLTNPLLLAWWREFTKAHNGEDDDEEAVAAELFDESCSIQQGVPHAISTSVAEGAVALQPD